MHTSKWWFVPLFFLCLIQFAAMADDSAFANSLSAITIDLHATVAQMQFANMIYSLIAGSIMITAGLLGSKIGLKRLLIVGLIIFIVAETIIWLAPNIYVLVYVGRVLAGIGGSLCVPALLGLVTALYTDKRVALSYGLIGATTAIGSSLAPILSGLIIVYINWRISFFALAILLLFGLIGAALTIHPTPKAPSTQRFDFIGFLLLFAGFTSLMFGIAHISSWGFIDASNAPFKIAGFSPVIFFISIGVFLLVAFWRYENQLEARFGDTAVILPRIFMTNAAIRGGIIMSAYVFYILGGLMFSIVLFMQIVLNQSPIMSGIYISIFSVGMSLSSIGTPIVAKSWTLKRLCQLGIGVTSFATLIVMEGLNTMNVTPLFYVGLFFVGIGVGIVASQCNLAVASAISDKELANKSSGIQGAARNIGESFGIALLGIMLMLGLTASVKNHINSIPQVPQSIQTEVHLSHSIPFLSNTDMRALLSKQSMDPAVMNELIQLNETARLHAMRVTMLMLTLTDLLFLLATFGITNKKLRDLSNVEGDVI